MNSTPLTSCCKCLSLRAGTLISGFFGIILAILGIVCLLFLNVEYRTIIIDTFPQWIVKIILGINMLMTIFISILLIIGTLKKNMYLMIPWVILGLLLDISILISVVYNAVVLFIDSFVLIGSLWLVFGLIGIIIYTYMWLVVYCYFLIIKDETERGIYMKPPYERQTVR